MKRGFPHTSNLPTLIIHNFKLVEATDLKVEVVLRELR